MDREKVIADIEEQITWIRDNDFHKFPGWGHAVLAMKDALALLKEQKSWINEIAEYQQSISGSGMHELDDYEKGKWDGLQIAWNIISEGR